MTKKTYYGFQYSNVQETMTRYMPYVIEDINNLVDHLMSLEGAEFICYDELEDTEDFVHGYTDLQMYYNAHLEITRQLSGFLFQCLPPIISKHEEPFLLPHQLVPEYVDTWMSDIANSGYDDRERASRDFFENGGYEKLIADWQAERKTLRGRIKSIASKLKRIVQFAVRTIRHE